MSASSNCDILIAILMLTDREFRNALDTCLPHQLRLIEDELTTKLNQTSRYNKEKTKDWPEVGKGDERATHSVPEDYLNDPRVNTPAADYHIPVPTEGKPLPPRPCMHDPYSGEEELRCYFPKGHVGEHHYTFYQGFVPKFCGKETYVYAPDAFVDEMGCLPMMKICFLLEGHEGDHLYQNQEEIKSEHRS